MLTKSLSLATLLAGAAAAPWQHHKPGFVTTDGTKFSLHGKEFFFAGSNAYYFPFMNVRLAGACTHLLRILTFARTKATSSSDSGPQRMQDCRCFELGGSMIRT